MAFCLIIGVYPQPFIRAMQPEVDAIAAIYDGERPNPLALRSAAEEQLASALGVNQEAAR
jgi:hypothetical protein